jgi:hypothetical protein
MRNDLLAGAWCAALALGLACAPGCDLRRKPAPPKRPPGVTDEGMAILSRTEAWPVGRIGKGEEKLLADGREWFGRLLEKYNETGPMESDPLLATRLLTAWRDDADAVGKLKVERMKYAMGVAIGDAISARTGLQWRVVDRRLLALASDDGMLVVLPFDISDVWMDGYSQPNLNDLTGKIRYAQQHDKGRVRTFFGAE